MLVVATHNVKKLLADGGLVYSVPSQLLDSSFNGPTSEELRNSLGNKHVSEVMKTGRLLWFGHVESKNE